MPQYGNASPSANSEADLYSDDSAAPEQSDESSGEESGETTLVPKSMCPGMKPGDEITLKIKSVQDDQYEVYYPESREEESEPAEASMPQGNEMSSMME